VKSDSETKNSSRAIRIPLLTALFLALAASGCSNKAVEYRKNGEAKRLKGDLKVAMADQATAAQLKQAASH